MKKESLRKKTINSIIWKFSSSIYLQFSSLIISSVLAHILSPDDFGIVGMVTVFTGFAIIVCELGFSSAIVQRKKLEDEHISSAFWMNILFGILLMGAFILSAPFIASFYNMYELRAIINWLSISFVFSSISITHKAILKKQMAFYKISIIEVVSVSVGGITGILMALNQMGPWSLVAQKIINTLVQSVLFLLLSNWRPNLVISKKHLNEILPFSIRMTGSNILAYLSRNVDYLLVGKFLGASELGIYTIAYRLMLYPLQNISWIIASVMFPALSQVQDDLTKMRTAYLKMNRAVAMISFPVVMLLYVLTPEILDLIAGNKWSKAIPLVRILCFAGFMQSITTLASNVRLSLGQAGLHLKLGIFNSIGVAVAIVIGLQWGLNGVALSYTFYNMVFFFVSNSLSLRLIKVSIPNLLHNLALPFLLGIIVSIVASFSKKIPVSSFIWIRLLFPVLFASSAYFVLLIIFKQIKITGKKLTIEILK